MAKSRTQQVQSVLAGGDDPQPRKKRAAVKVAPVTPTEDVAVVVERAVLLITAMVRKEYGITSYVERAGSCEICEHSDDAHLHRSTLFQAGHEVF